MPRVRLFFVLIGLAALSLVAAGDTPMAVTYRDQAHAYQVVFPGTPRKKALSVSSGGTTMPVEVVYCGDDNKGVSVMAMTFPRQANLAAHRQEAIDLVLNRMRTKAGVSVRQDDRIDVDGAPGRHVVLTMGEKRWSEAYVFTHGDSLFALITASASLQGLKDAGYRRFLTSFKLNG